MTLLTVGVAVTPSMAQTEGSIVLTDEYYDDCGTYDLNPGVRTIWVWHGYNAGSTASSFKIESGIDFTMTYLSEDHHFPMTFGNTQDGITVCYGECRVGDQLLVSINYMAYGTSGPCGLIHVVPNPAMETVEAMRCDGTPVRMSVQDLYVISPDNACGCPSVHSFPGTLHVIDCTASPVETTTWGAVKALYRD